MKLTFHVPTQWVDIKGYEGIYMVSSNGNVKSLSRAVNHSTSGVMKVLRERIMSPGNCKGYMVVGLRKGGNRVSRFVHRLVAEAFIGEIGENEINHKNGIKDDNRVENIEIVSHKENIQHSYTHLKRKVSRAQLGKTGKLHHLSKPVIQKDFLGNVVKVWESMGRAEEFGFDSGQISKCCKGKIKQHKQFKWYYL